MKSRRTTEEAIRAKLNFTIDLPLRDQLLARALREQEQSQETEPVLQGPVIRRMIMRIPIPRVAAIVLVCIGVVTAIGVTAVRYHYLGTGDGGHHHFISTDGQSVVTMDQNDVPDVEQAQNDLQEMKLLSEQGKREVVKVVRTEVNGGFERKIFIYRYCLADGRTREMGEAAPGNAGRWILTESQYKELMQLRKAGPGKDLGAYEEEIEGRTFTFQRQQYVLSDGTEVVWSIGKPGNTP